MDLRSTRALFISASIALGVVAFSPMAAIAATVVTDQNTGDVTVTLADNSSVIVSSSLAAQIVSAMNSGDAAAVTDAIKALVKEYAANNPRLATAIYILAVNTTTNAALQAAAYAGVVAGNPSAATEVADNSSGGGAPPGGQGGGGGSGNGNGNFPSGGTSGGGSTPSPNGP
jgi:hypothetical protein